MATEYEIVWAIKRKRDDEEDFSEIGFGASGSWEDPAQCAHMVDSDVQNYTWETDAKMPDPQAIKADVEAER